jgi:hypothetical protein
MHRCRFNLPIHFTMFFLFLYNLLWGQAVIIDHHSTDFGTIPTEWLQAAKEDLFIAYGHTSHGSQLISGMTALEIYFEDGRFDFSSEEGEATLHLMEGSGYGEGYLSLDCGYPGWEEESRIFLDDHPTCNVLMWSWCGQVNSVDLLNHYLRPMERLEQDYPNVKVVYMTGHLEGLGPEGSVHQANQQIREYCMVHDKILFDFADIERYDPDQQTDYLLYYADDACNYDHPDGYTGNWAEEWIVANPESEWSVLAEMCSYCAHSEGLNCVQKAAAAWHLYAQIAGWDGQTTPVKDTRTSAELYCFPVPFTDVIQLRVPQGSYTIEILGLTGYLWESQNFDKKGTYELDLSSLPGGFYLLRSYSEYKSPVFQLIMKL